MPVLLWLNRCLSLIDPLQVAVVRATLWLVLCIYIQGKCAKSPKAYELEGPDTMENVVLDIYHFIPMDKRTKDSAVPWSTILGLPRGFIISDENLGHNSRRME